MSQHVSQSSQPVISLRKALESSQKTLLENLQLYNEAHEAVSLDDIHAFTKDQSLVQLLLSILQTEVQRNVDVFIQALQITVALANDEECTKLLVDNGVLDVLHAMDSKIDKHHKEKDIYHNFLFAVQIFCENPKTRKRAGELFLLEFCEAILYPHHTNVRRSLMGCVNALLQASPENKALLEKAQISFPSFIKTLKECGDHYLQQQVVEFLYRAKKLFEGKEIELFENKADVAAAFGEIKGKEGFNGHLRTFLLAFNRSMGSEQRVFSLKAQEVHIGESYQQEATWVDFGAEHATFDIHTEEEPAQFDLEYGEIRHLKLADKGKPVGQLKFRLKSTPDILKDIYDSAKDEWISVLLAAGDIDFFSKHIASIIMKVQKQATAPQQADTNKVRDGPKSAKARERSPAKLPAKSKSASSKAETLPVMVDHDYDSEPDRRITRSQNTPKPEVARPAAQGTHPMEKKAKPSTLREPTAPIRESPASTLGRKRRASEALDLDEQKVEAFLKQPMATLREPPPLKQPRRPANAVSAAALRTTLDLRESPPRPARRTSAPKPEAFDLDSDPLKLDFPMLLSQGDAVVPEDVDGDDDGSLGVIQKQFESLMAKQRESTRKKGTTKINETMALVQRRLDAFKADSARRREELQTESGDRLGRLQQELADAKKGINQMVARFQAEIKESLATLQSISEQVAQLAHEHESGLPQQLKVEEDQALRDLKTEVEGEVHRLDKQLQSASKDTKTIKLLGQLISKALAE